MRQIMKMQRAFFRISSYPGNETSEDSSYRYSYTSTMPHTIYTIYTLKNKMLKPNKRECKCQ